MPERHPEEWEIVRRSIAMLAPRHPAPLNREAAMELLDELQRLQHANRHLNALFEQLWALVVAAAEASTGHDRGGPPPPWPGMTG